MLLKSRERILIYKKDTLSVPFYFVMTKPFCEEYVTFGFSILIFSPLKNDIFKKLIAL